MNVRILKKINDDAAFAEEVLLYCGAMQLAKELSIAERKILSRTLCTKQTSLQKKCAVFANGSFLQPPQLSLLLLYYSECSILIHRHHFKQKAEKYIAANLTEESVQMGVSDDMEQGKRTVQSKINWKNHWLYSIVSLLRARVVMMQKGWQALFPFV